MGIHRVPGVPFTQIANSALRDRRLSFKARGILAMVLSNVGEWEATADWIEKQSDADGKHAIQTALNELTEYGYRIVSKVHDEKGLIHTVTEWSHEPIIRPPENPTVGKTDHRKTGASIEQHPLEQHKDKNNKKKKPHIFDAGFEEFWQTYPRRTAKGAAQTAWAKAIIKEDADVIIAAAAAFAADVNREDWVTPHPSTWLNQRRWEDDPLPARQGRVSGTRAYLATASELEYEPLQLGAYSEA
jgi:hypothetical protein